MFTFATWSEEEAQKFYQARAPVKLDLKIPLVQALKSCLLFEDKTALVDDPLAIIGNSLARLLRRQVNKSFGKIELLTDLPSSANPAA